MSRPQSDLTKYILSPKEVIAKATDKGYETTEKNVHRVRAAAKKAKKNGPARKTAPAKKAGVEASPRADGGSHARKGGNKSAFVRGIAASTPAKDVVAMAKAAGMTLNDRYVYNIRASAKAKGRGGKSAPAKAPLRGHASATGAEHTFVSAALDLGLARAVQILSILRDRAKTLSV